MPGEHLEKGTIRVESDPEQPDWRFHLLLSDELVGEVYFDADHGWREADRPRGWMLRFTPQGSWDDELLEVPVAPEGESLRWAAREDAAREAVRLVSQRLAA